MPQRHIPGTMETITLGPFGIFFCNTNTEMGLKGHCHTASVSLEYETLSSTGYPSFQQTNDAVRQRLRELTGVDHPFRDSTNEDVCRALFTAFNGWQGETWQDWGGSYQLHAVHLDVVGVHDRIGHDEGTTRYSILRTGSPA